MQSEILTWPVPGACSVVAAVVPTVFCLVLSPLKNNWLKIERERTEEKRDKRSEWKEATVLSDVQTAGL